MPKSSCEHCGAAFTWDWEDAFMHYGFNSGDGVIMTDDVANALRQNGYEVDVDTWPMHNPVITSIKRCGEECIPKSVDTVHDAPRDYLPQHVIDVLDAAFGDSEKPEDETFPYIVEIIESTIYEVPVKAANKHEAYAKAQARFDGAKAPCATFDYTCCTDHGWARCLRPADTASDDDAASSNKGENK